MKRIDVAIRRANVRKTMIRDASNPGNATLPGKLENESMWKLWEEKFINYLNTQLGANGVPLSYVIRDDELPDVHKKERNFIKRCILCAPLEGEYYLADRQRVHNLIVNATSGCPSADWIKSSLKYSNGRRTWKKLVNHFAGPGTASVALAEAEKLRNTLHYRNERAMSFEKFLTNCEKMYNQTSPA